MNETRPMIFHDVAAGADRLLRQPLDLSVSGHSELRLEDASPEYGELFRKYTIDLEWSAHIAIEWWNSLVARSMRAGLTEKDAIRAQYENRPAGPAARPEIVCVVRNYWLQVISLNARHPGGFMPAPQTFLLAWLPSAGYSHLYDILTAMPYWPIGLDENGNWC